MDPLYTLPRHTYGHKVKIKPETEAQNRMVEDLARFLAKGRAAAYWPKVDFGETPELASMQVEEPYRTYDQLRVLSHALSRVHGRAEITDHELNLLRQVVHATIPTNRARVLEVLRDSELDRQALVAKTGIGRHRSERAIAELEYVKLIQAGKGKSKGGQPLKTYSLVDGVSSLLPRGLSDHLGDLSKA
jgi:hypothetical protein